VGRLVVIREYRYEIAVSHDANHAWHVLRRRCVNFDETSAKGRSPQDAGEQHSRPEHVLRVNSPPRHARLCVNSPDVGSHHREVSLLGERYLLVDLPLDRLTIDELAICARAPRVRICGHTAVEHHEIFPWLMKPL